MEYSVDTREIHQSSITSPDINNYRNKSTGKLFLYNGSYQMVYTDTENKEFIYTKDGKKLYLKDIPILSLNNNQITQNEKLMSDFDKMKSGYEKWKQHWFNKFNVANKSYEICTTLKKQANKSYQSILSKTGCSSLADLKEYDKVNGGDNFKQAQMYLSERTDARMGQIRAESDSIFYGRMYVDESNNVTSVEYQKMLAQHLLG